MASQITATLPTLNFPKEVDYPTQEDWAAFSAAAEVNFGILGGSWSTQMQLWKTEANAMSIELNNNADIINSASNYQGDWVSKGYTLGQSVSVSGIYYICKLTHTTGQNPTDMGSLYWSLVIGNWNLKADKTEVALKVDKNMSAYTTKTTPVDADLIPLSDSDASFGIKKLSWVNLKDTLKTYFDTLYTISSSETTAGIIELATTVEAQTGTDAVRAITPLQLFNSLKGSRQSLASNGYQKLHGGLIIQWGTISLPAQGETTITFPISFPTSCLVVTAAGLRNSNDTAAEDIFFKTKSTSTALLYNSSNPAQDAMYIAIGY